MANILVLDDEINIRGLMSKALQTHGHTVTTVPSAGQAQEMIFQKQFDLVVLDIQVAGESGISVLKKIRENNKEIPVVIYSGCVTQDIEREAKSAGATEVLRKDVAISQLVLQISKILAACDRITQGLTLMRKKPLLIVDDEPEIRGLLKEFFSNRGYDVLEAENGELATEIVRSREISVTLLDLNMPGMDGLVTLEKILEINPHTGVVMATAIQDDKKVSRAITMGAYGYVLKPFDFLYLELVVMSRLALAQG